MLFQFFSQRGTTVSTSTRLKSVLNAGRYDDDAFFPTQTANFGTINGVTLNLLAFSPIHPTNLDKMAFPYAFFEITLANPQSTSVDVACALQIDTASVPLGVAGKGIRSSGGVEYAAYGNSSDASAIITYGSDAGFLSNGQCNNTPSGTLNKVAVKVTLAANQTKTIRFVLAWYNGSDTLPDHYYYANTATNAGAFADLGLGDFDLLKGYATALVNKMRASNLPDWLKNQTMNSLADLANNWVYAKDGRLACAEGQFLCMGTMDQMWHARPIYAMVNPKIVWQELQYWARTQKTSPAGQIHHDFGNFDTAMVAWDDQQHADYRTIDAWPDLNCGFIISVYEAFLATNDTTQLNYFWPYVKKAGQRIIDQLTPSLNTAYPYTFTASQSSYDNGGSSDAYCSGLILPTFKIMSDLCAKQGETTLKSTYDSMLTSAKATFQSRWFNPAVSNFPYGHLSEGALAGQQLGFYLKFDQFMPSANLDYGISSVGEYYDPIYGLGYTAGTYDEWAEYLVLHYGGMLLQTGRLQEWVGQQYDYYERVFLNRNRVFNASLGIFADVTTPTYVATSTAGDSQYISYPDLWRNYFEIVGYHRRKDTGELWVEPRIPAELNHVLTNGMFVSPEGMGTVSSTESGTRFQNQSLTVTSESAISVSKLYIKDTFGTNVTSVTVNGASQTFSRIGTGYARRLSINWTGTVGTSGIAIVATGDAPAAPNQFNAFDVIEAESYTSMSGVNTQATTDNGGGVNVGWIENNDYIAFNNVNFDTGADQLELRVASAASSATITARLDSLTGPIIGTCAVSNTGGWQNWVTNSCAISGASGIHPVYLVFTGGSGYLLNINFLRFTRSAYPSKLFTATDRNQAEEYNATTGVVDRENGSDTPDSWDVGFIKNGDYLCYNRVNFGAGVSSVDLRVASGSAGGTVQVRLDSPTGTLIGSTAVTGTGGWQTWSTKTFSVSGATGLHKLYFVFSGGTGYLMNFNWFQFH